MKKAFILTLALCAASSFSTADSDDELQTIYITAPSKIEEEQNRTATSVTVITEEDIEASGQVTLPELLRATGSIGVSSNGGVGKVSTLRIRGEEGYRTHVYVDGIRNLDVTAPQATPRLEHIKLQGIERIEVLRGTQGFVYGADAGGVVNIITREGQGELETNYTQSRGSDNSVDTVLDLSAGNDYGDFYLFASDYETDGFNARTDDLDGEDDGYKNTTFHGKLGFKPDENIRLQAVINKVDADSEYDSQFGGSNDQLSKFSQLNNSYSAEYKSNKIKQFFAYTQSESGTDAFEDGAKSRSTEGKVNKAEYHGAYKLKNSTIVVGIDSESQKNLLTDTSTTNTGSFIEYKNSHIKHLFIDFGLRLDRNSTYGEHLSSRLSTAYLINAKSSEYKIRASIGRGFRAPSLYESTNLAPGVDDLKEENSRGYDLGLDWTSDKGATMSATYFYQEINDEIEYVGVWPDAGYSQVNGTSISKGIEFFSLLPLDANWEISTNYTFNEAEESDGSQRVRRPKHLVNLSAKYIYNDFIGSIGLRGLKDAIDTDGEELDNYIVVNTGFTYELSDSVSVFGSINNALNREYEEVRGYNTPDRNFNFGTTISF